MDNAVKGTGIVIKALKQEFINSKNQFKRYK